MKTHTAPSARPADAFAAASPPSFTVSAFFSAEAQINQAIAACLHRGIPRDLIDVAVSNKAAKRFYAGSAGPNRDSWFSWAGRGALAGLLLSAGMALIILLVWGYQTSKPMAMVQLLGPDLGVIIGAVLGALYGWLKPGDQQPQFARALHREDAALLLVHLQPAAEAEAISALLRQYGGDTVLVEQDSLKAVGAE